MPWKPGFYFDTMADYRRIVSERMFYNFVEHLQQEVPEDVQIDFNTAQELHDEIFDGLNMNSAIFGTFLTRSREVLGRTFGSEIVDNFFDNLDNNAYLDEIVQEMGHIRDVTNDATLAIQVRDNLYRMGFANLFVSPYDNAVKNSLFMNNHFDGVNGMFLAVDRAGRVSSLDNPRSQAVLEQAVTITTVTNALQTQPEVVVENVPEYVSNRTFNNNYSAEQGRTKAIQYQNNGTGRIVFSNTNEGLVELNKFVYEDTFYRMVDELEEALPESEQHMASELWRMHDEVFSSNLDDNTFIENMREAVSKRYAFDDYKDVVIPGYMQDVRNRFGVLTEFDASTNSVHQLPISPYDERYRTKTMFERDLFHRKYLTNMTDADINMQDVLDEYNPTMLNNALGVISIALRDGQYRKVENTKDVFISLEDFSGLSELRPYLARSEYAKYRESLAESWQSLYNDHESYLDFIAKRKDSVIRNSDENDRYIDDPNINMRDKNAIARGYFIENRRCVTKRAKAILQTLRDNGYNYTLLPGRVDGELDVKIGGTEVTVRIMDKPENIYMVGRSYDSRTNIRNYTQVENGIGRSNSAVYAYSKSQSHRDSFKLDPQYYTLPLLHILGENIPLPENGLFQYNNQQDFKLATDRDGVARDSFNSVPNMGEYRGDYIDSEGRLQLPARPVYSTGKGQPRELDRRNSSGFIMPSNSSKDYIEHVMMGLVAVDQSNGNIQYGFDDNEIAGSGEDFVRNQRMENKAVHMVRVVREYTAKDNRDKLENNFWRRPEDTLAYATIGQYISRARYNFATQVDIEELLAESEAEVQLFMQEEMNPYLEELDAYNREIAPFEQYDYEMLIYNPAVDARPEAPMGERPERPIAPRFGMNQVLDDLAVGINVENVSDDVKHLRRAYAEFYINQRLTEEGVIDSATIALTDTITCGDPVCQDKSVVNATLAEEQYAQRIRDNISAADMVRDNFAATVDAYIGTVKDAEDNPVVYIRRGGDDKRFERINSNGESLFANTSGVGISEMDTDKLVYNPTTVCEYQGSMTYSDTEELLVSAMRRLDEVKDNPIAHHYENVTIGVNGERDLSGRFVNKSVRFNRSQRINPDDPQGERLDNNVITYQQAKLAVYNQDGTPRENVSKADEWRYKCMEAVRITVSASNANIRPMVDQTGAEIPGTYDIQIDDAGVIKYKARRRIETGTTEKQLEAVTRNGRNDITGEVGQIFLPTEEGLYETTYEGTRNLYFAYGHEAYALNQIDNAGTFADRLRLVPMENRILQTIQKQVRDDISRPDNNYDVGGSTTINHIYRDITTSSEFDRNHKEIAEALGQDAKLHDAIVKIATDKVTLIGAEYEEDASVVTESMHRNDRPNVRRDDIGMDAWDLTGHQNVSVLTEGEKKFFDAPMSPNSKKVTEVRYKREGTDVVFDKDSGKYIMVPTLDENGKPITRSTLFEQDVLKYSEFDAFNRQQIVASNVRHGESVTKEPCKIAWMQMGGHNQDDAAIVSKEFCESHMIRDNDGNLRSLTIGDKISDLHGNKSVIGEIVDINAKPELSEDASDLDKLRYELDYKKWLVFSSNPELEVVLSPQSMISRLNGGSYREAHDNGYEPLYIPGLTMDKLGDDADLYESWIVNEEEFANLSEDIRNQVHNETVDADGNKLYEIGVVSKDGIGDMHEIIQEKNVESKTSYNGKNMGWQTAPNLEVQGVIDVLRHTYGRNNKGTRAISDALRVGLGFDCDSCGTLHDEIMEHIDENERTEEVFDACVISDDVIGKQDTIRNCRSEFLDWAKDSGGFVELPFELKYPSHTLELSKYDYDKLMADGKLAEDGSFVDNDRVKVKTDGNKHTMTIAGIEIMQSIDDKGNKVDSWQLPVMYPTSRRDVQTQQGEFIVREYTDSYLTIVSNAIKYAEEKRRFEKEKEDFEEGKEVYGKLMSSDVEYKDRYSKYYTGGKFDEKKFSSDVSGMKKIRDAVNAIKWDPIAQNAGLVWDEDNLSETVRVLRENPNLVTAINDKLNDKNSRVKLNNDVLDTLESMSDIFYVSKKLDDFHKIGKLYDPDNKDYNNGENFVKAKVTHENKLKSYKDSAQMAFNQLSNKAFEQTFDGRDNLAKSLVMRAKYEGQGAMAVWSSNPKLKYNEMEIGADLAQALGVKENGIVMIDRSPVLKPNDICAMHVRINHDLDKGGCRVNPDILAYMDGDADGDQIAITAPLNSRMAKNWDVCLSPARFMVDYNGKEPKFRLGAGLDAKCGYAHNPELKNKLDALKDDSKDMCKEYQELLEKYANYLVDNDLDELNAYVIKKDFRHKEAYETIYKPLVAIHDKTEEQMDKVLEVSLESEIAEIGRNNVCWGDADRHVSSIENSCLKTGVKGSYKALDTYARYCGISHVEKVVTGDSKQVIFDEQGNEMVKELPGVAIAYDENGNAKLDKNAEYKLNEHTFMTEDEFDDCARAQTIKSYKTGEVGKVMQHLLKGLNDKLAAAIMAAPIYQMALDAKHNGYEAQKQMEMLPAIRGVLLHGECWEEKKDKNGNVIKDIDGDSIWQRQTDENNNSVLITDPKQWKDTVEALYKAVGQDSYNDRFLDIIADECTRDGKILPLFRIAEENESSSPLARSAFEENANGIAIGCLNEDQLFGNHDRIFMTNSMRNMQELVWSGEVRKEEPYRAVSAKYQMHIEDNPVLLEREDEGGESKTLKVEVTEPVKNGIENLVEEQNPEFVSGIEAESEMSEDEALLNKIHANGKAPVAGVIANNDTGKNKQVASEAVKETNTIGKDVEVPTTKTLDEVLEQNDTLTLY